MVTSEPPLYHPPIPSTRLWRGQSLLPAGLSRRPARRESRQALARRDRLIEKLASLPPVPGALDQIVQRFGADLVAEVTGRARRVVSQGRSADGREPCRLGQPRGNGAPAIPSSPPAIRSTPGHVVREVQPGVAVRAVVLAHGAPGAVADVEPHRRQPETSSWLCRIRSLSASPFIRELLPDRCGEDPVRIDGLLGEQATAEPSADHDSRQRGWWPAADADLDDAEISCPPHEPDDEDASTSNALDRSKQYYSCLVDKFGRVVLDEAHKIRNL